jgi:hypothetical protein
MEFFSTSSLLFRIGLNVGVQFGIAGAIKSGNELGKQKLDSNLDKVNAAFAVVKAYTVVNRLMSSTASGGIGALVSIGAWIGFSTQYSHKKVQTKRAVPTIINATHIVLNASNISMKATQIFAFDAYFKARYFNTDPGKYKFKRDANGKVFGFEFGVDFSSIFGKKAAGKVGEVFDKLKIGRIPIGEYLPTFTLGKDSGEEMRHIPTNIQVAGNLTMDIGVEATIRGTNIEANKLFASFEMLILESVHDIVRNKDWSAASGILHDTQKILKSLAGSYSKEKGSVVDQVTKLVGKDVAKIVVARALHLHGAMIANAEKNEKGEYTDKGKLTLEVGDLVVKYLYNSGKGVIINGAYEFLDEAMESTRTIGYKDRSGVVEAIIGRGNLTVHGEHHGDSLSRNVDAVNHKDNTQSPIKALKIYTASDTPSLDKFCSNVAGAANRLRSDFADFFAPTTKVVEEVEFEETPSTDADDRDIDEADTLVEQESEDAEENVVNDEISTTEVATTTDKQEQLSVAASTPADITPKNGDMCEWDDNEPKQTRFVWGEDGKPRVVVSASYAYGLIFTIGANTIDKLDIAQHEKEAGKTLLYNFLSKYEQLSPEDKAALVREYKEKNIIEKILEGNRAHANPIALEGVEALVGMCLRNPGCRSGLYAAGTAFAATSMGKWLADQKDDILNSKIVRTYLDFEELEARSWKKFTNEKSRNNVRSGKNTKPTYADTYGTPNLDPNNDWEPEEHGWTKNKDEKWHHPDAKNIKGIHNRPNVQNTRLSKQLDELYRPTDKRPGGTAGELRREVQYNLKKEHLVKAQERVNNLQRIVKEESLSRSDRKVAERIISDLRDAINQSPQG